MTDTDLPVETPSGATTPDALERLVLGAAFEDPDALERATATGLRAEDFSSDERATLWRALCHCAAQSLPYDAMGLESALIAVAPQWGTPRRHDAIAVVVDSVCTGAFVDQHARGVTAWARLRRATRFAHRALSTSPQSPQGVSAWLDRFAEGALKACEDATEDTRPVPLSAAVDALVERRLHPTPEPEEGRLSLPWHAVTHATGGLRPGQLIVLAARPKVGKSALALAIALHAATVAPVLFASLEMTRVEVAERVVSILGSVHADAAAGKRLPTHDEIDALMSARSLAEKLPVDVVDASAQTLTTIRAAARRMRARGGLSLIVVDYLQLMGSELTGRETTREREVAVLARGLKTLAKEMGCPVLCLSQLNRGGDELAAPTLRNLRESGAIEQDANAVWFLHRPTPPNAAEATEDIVLTIAAQRSGACGVEIKLTYRKAWLTFFESEAMPHYTEEDV
jgi:replicative DNA helicase